MPLGHFRCFSRASSPQFDAETCSSDLSSLLSENGSESEIESDNEAQEIVCIKSKRYRYINDLPLEVVALIRDYLSDVNDLRRFMRVQRSWYTLGVRKLWAKPAVITHARLDRLGDILSRGLADENSINPPLVGDLAAHVRRLNLCHVSLHVKNFELLKFQRCRNLERLVLQNCQLVEPLALEKLLRNMPALVSVDMQMMPQITDSVIDVLTSTAQDLQVFYGGGINLTNDSIAMFRRVKPSLRRFRLSQSPLIALSHILELATECINLVELDLSGLERNPEIENPGDHRRQGLEPHDLKQILLRCAHLRELRLDKLVAQQPDHSDFSVLHTVCADNLRILTLAMSPCLTDSVLECILFAVPKLRHINISKCPLISDRSLHLIAQAYNHGLHYLHLGHCYRITDRGIEAITELCDRLTYFDAANCARLTNRALGLLGKLPRLRRIGLVKCNEITGVGLLAFTSQALASVRADTPSANATTSAGVRHATLLAPPEPSDFDETGSTSSSAHDLPARPSSSPRTGHIPLERLHLSYCSQISMESVRDLLRVCPKLLHLSLTGVRAFMRNDVMRLSRPPPSELHENQQQLFCVFSGQGIVELRRFFQAVERYERAQELRPLPETTAMRPPPPNVSQVLSLLEELDEVGNSVRDTIIWSGGFSDVDDRAVEPPPVGSLAMRVQPPLRPRVSLPFFGHGGAEIRDQILASRRGLTRLPETATQPLMSVFTGTPEPPIRTSSTVPDAVNELAPPSSTANPPVNAEMWGSPSGNRTRNTVEAADESVTRETHSPGIDALISDHLWPEMAGWTGEPASQNQFAERPNIDAPYFERPNFELPSRTASLSPAEPSQTSSNHSSTTQLADPPLNESDLADVLAVLRLRRSTEADPVPDSTEPVRRRRFSRL